MTDAPWLEAQQANGWEPDWGYWGSETETMYEVFARLSEGRPSVTIVANGGGITIDEVAANIRQGRRMVVIEGSGRASDAIVAALAERQPESETVATYSERVAELDVRRHGDLFRVFSLRDGPEALAAVLIEELD